MKKGGPGTVCEQEYRNWNSGKVASPVTVFIVVETVVYELR